jgi:phosphatidylglycerophosphate synthase
MFDARLRPLIDPPLNLAGRLLGRLGISADAITLAGLGLGLGGALAIILAQDMAALLLILACRIADGLDGAVARATTRTDRGGFLDIVADFAFYGAIPLAFALRDPASNALPAAALLCAFYVNGAAFLAFAALAAKRGIETQAQGQKSLFYLSGLMEGAETILFFLAMALWPAWFPALAWAFAALTLVSAAARVIQAWTSLQE